MSAGEIRWWACCSFRQFAVDLRTESAATHANFCAFQENREVNFVPLGVFRSEVEARNFLSRIQELRDSLSKMGGKYEC